MFARFGKILVIVALVATTGAHWAALQTVAWTAMLAGNLHSGSFHDAVAKTFDGEHPCCLCKAIAAARKSGEKSAAAAPELKLEFAPVAEKIILFPPAQFELLPQENFSAPNFMPRPPVPPPRGFFV